MPAESDLMKFKRVLVVEDEAITALAETKLLASFGYEPCGIAVSADEAIEAFTRERPDIVCMDVGIQGRKDGLQAAAAMLAKRPAEIVVISGYDDEERRAEAAKLGAASFLVKPVTRDQFRAGLKAASDRAVSRSL